MIMFLLIRCFVSSLRYDDPERRRGVWLNANITLPPGGSGGAAVNSRGELVGICTQMEGGLTNIRCVSEALRLVTRSVLM